MAPPPGGYPNTVTYLSAVGEPYADGNGCHGIFLTISLATGIAESDYDCQAWNTISSTLITVVTAQENQDKLNAALAEAYPAVQDGFDCKCDSGC
ncbi:hypothetical protein LTR36_005263 [Oleoguttula mirabilis]|uniref:Uncharacterized protein n=1 Tax=Oleoguttula mirabilis TaxID=1507867 RepID=A0AAV9JEG9_9PEZI|nr:hypothetical protein LTR36_005263 [Oleoguttula mirabilis]